MLSRAFGGSEASALDVFFAYRLLLGRNPDPEGFAHHLARLSLLKLSPREVARDFVSSDEAVQAPPEPVLVKCATGFELFVDPRDQVVGKKLREGGRYEPAVEEAIRRLLKPGDRFVDVGANVGYFSFLAATLGCEVIAVEPLADLLERSINRSGVKIELHRAAAGDGERTVHVRQLDVANGGSGKLSDQGVAVPMRTLDSMLAGRAVKLVKLDIEGAEELALIGLSQRPALIIECDARRVALLELLVDRGYALRRVESETPLPLPQLLEEIAHDDHADLLATVS
jgi:FkbM family methyltransferase